jgi:hypothetical protein
MAPMLIVQAASAVLAVHDQAQAVGRGARRFQSQESRLEFKGVKGSLPIIVQVILLLAPAGGQ